MARRRARVRAREKERPALAGAVGCARRQRAGNRPSSPPPSRTAAGADFPPASA